MEQIEPQGLFPASFQTAAEISKALLSAVMDLEAPIPPLFDALPNWLLGYSAERVFFTAKSASTEVPAAFCTRAIEEGRPSQVEETA